MITKTTLSALRALRYLAGEVPGRCVSPRMMAKQLGESPTYVAKIARELVKAGILRAKKGSRGGVFLGRLPSEITLLSVVQACQGEVVGDYCWPGCTHDTVCSYHEAAAELHTAIVDVLSRWTLARMLERPHPPARSLQAACMMSEAGYATGRRPPEAEQGPQ
jgi:Rrf2 family protein